MTDWNAVVAARELNIPPEDVAKSAPILDQLEAAFRPLVKDLPRAYSESE